MDIVPNSSRSGRKSHSGKEPQGGWRKYPAPNRNPYFELKRQYQDFIDVYCSGRPRAVAAKKLGYTLGTMHKKVGEVAAELDAIAFRHRWNDWDKEKEPAEKIERCYAEATRGSTTPDPRKGRSIIT